MKRYVKSDTNTKFLYHHLSKESQEYALANFIWYMHKKYNVDLSEYDADEMLADSNTAFDEYGYTVDNNGNPSNDLYILPNNWKDYITNNFNAEEDKRKRFNNAIENGIIYYDEHFGGYIYEYSEMGFTDEIFIGKTKEEAFKEFCEINW